MDDQTQAPPHVELHRRVGALETTITSLSTEFNYVRNDLTHVSSQLEKISEDINKNQKTHWPTIISVVGVVLVIVGMFFSGYGSDISKLEYVQHENTKFIMEHSKQLATLEALIKK